MPGRVNVLAVALILAALLVGCPPGDTIRVVAATPQNGAMDVSLEAVLSIAFDVAADSDSMDLEIEPETNLSASWSADRLRVTLTPTGPLLPSTVYTVTVWDVEPAGGGSIEKEYTFSFTTAAADSVYRRRMRNFVQAIAAYARQTDPAFIVIPQNGEALLTVNGTSGGALSADYIAAIDGQGREDLFYGYGQDNRPTPAAARDAMLGMLFVAEEAGVEALVTDYCSSHTRVDDSYARNEAQGFISFAAPERDLNVIPTYPSTPRNVSALDVTRLDQARNFLYLLDPGTFANRAAYLTALASTDYDLMILDLFYDDTALATAELDALRTKAAGGTRLLIAYMSIGEAEDYRYYWQAGWTPGTPAWIEPENPDWEGNYKVRYWDPDWQAVIFGHPDAYLDRIIDAGFDGVYLDIIDAYEYFEQVGT